MREQEVWGGGWAAGVADGDCLHSVDQQIPDTGMHISPVREGCLNHEKGKTWNEPCGFGKDFSHCCVSMEARMDGQMDR